jgi:hypothetical protein
LLDIYSDFLLSCARFRLDPQQFPVPVYPVAISEQKLVAQVKKNRVDGLLYKIEKTQTGIWPVSFQNQLKASYYLNFVYSERYINQARIVFSALREAGIAVIALKTWAFFPTVYAGDYSARSFVDVDLLVQPQDVRTAEAVLLAKEFRLANELWPGGRFRYKNAEFSYFKPLADFQKCNIDLHWGLFSRPYYDDRIQLADLFSRALPLEVAGAPALRLGIEDEILFTCGHLSLHHQYSSDLNRYYELAWLIRHADPVVNWIMVLERAKEWRLICPLKRIVLEMENRFPGTLSTEVVQALQRLHPGRNEEKTHAWFVKYSLTQLSIIIPARWTLGGIFNALGLLAETAFPSPRYLEGKYGPTKFLPSNYFRRLMDITGRLPDDK